MTNIFSGVIEQNGVDYGVLVRQGRIEEWPEMSLSKVGVANAIDVLTDVLKILHEMQETTGFPETTQEGEE